MTMVSETTRFDIALVMISIDRERQGKENYFTETMENLDRSVPLTPHRGAGWSGLFVSTPKCSHYEKYESWFDRVEQPASNERALVACENAGRALIAGGEAAQELGLSWVLFCEDDLDFCDDFFGSVGRWLDDRGSDPIYRLYAFGCAYPQVRQAAKNGHTSWWTYPYHAFYGTQCFAIRPHDAISLGAYIASNPLVRGVNNPNAYDLMFHDWMDANYPDGAFLASVPSFVQHIGRQSICTGKEITHTFDSWPGREWSYRGKDGATTIDPDGAKCGCEVEKNYREADLIDARRRLMSLEHELQRIESRPRVLWVGDSPTVNTGFSLCTRKVCAHLHQQGWDVHVLGLSYFGDPHQYPYQIHPAINPLDNSRDAYGCMRLPKLIHRLKPDVVVLLNDPWNVEAYLYQISQFERDAGVEIRNTFKLVGWLAVDGKNTSAHDFSHSDRKPDRTEKWGQLDHLAVWTDFAAEELVSGGWNGPLPSVIPLGVDADVFHPVDKAVARAKVLPVSIDPNCFLVGVVGRNQYRKRLDLSIQYFAEWITRNKVEDAYLYIHCAPTADKGVDIRSLAKYYGMTGRVILAKASLGVGIDENDMRLVYSSFDLKMTMTQGEGFDLTTLEAMACGVATMGPDWSGLASWAREAMIAIPCTTICMTAPIGGDMYTIGGIADKEEVIKALDRLYRYQSIRAQLGRAGLELSKKLTWESTATKFEEMLRDVLESNDCVILEEAHA